MNIYLDIDGTLIHENFAQPVAADGLTDFLLALRPHQTFWLTTHCRDGNPARAQEIMKQFVPAEVYGDIDRIVPTIWDTQKTQGIDWSHNFIWFDNDISAYEWEQFKTARENQQVIEVNLRTNPKQLLEIVRDVL